MELTPYRPDRRAHDRRTPKGQDALERTMFRAGRWSVHGPKVIDEALAVVIMGALLLTILIVPCAALGAFIGLVWRLIQ